MNPQLTVGCVHGFMEAAHASCQDLFWLACAQLCPSDGQIPVGVVTLLVHANVEGAVHGLQLQKTHSCCKASAGIDASICQHKNKYVHLQTLARSLQVKTGIWRHRQQHSACLVLLIINIHLVEHGLAVKIKVATGFPEINLNRMHYSGMPFDL